MIGWIFRIAIAGFAAWGLLKVGFGMIGSLARPIPAPPPDGELRRVNLRYRCPTCATEIRMVKTDAVDPVAPRHCMDEMDLIAVDGESVET
jgi:hypothetical protein